MRTQDVSQRVSTAGPLLLERSEAAESLRISIRKLDQLLQVGEITPVRIGSRVLVAWSELLRFVEKKSSVASAVNAGAECAAAVAQ
ncbi:MAG: helix-turn-helix domain-containing protein [Acidobacteriia bacterium]|nr:helix-turn-helix domain-containing protein [Terriglobia bacterium]